MLMSSSYPKGNAALLSRILPARAAIRQPEHMIDRKPRHHSNPATVTRREAVLLTLLAGCALPGNAMSAPTTKEPVPMSDPRVKTYETYLSAWSKIPDDERLRLLRESLSDNIVFTNPMKTRRGLAEVVEHLQAFQQRTPGGSFRLNEMLGWENHGIATWQLVDAQGQAGFYGYDVVAFDDHGCIETILLFSHIEKQTLK
jgi:hypothetical protein